MRDATSRALPIVLAACVLGATGPAAAQQETPDEREEEIESGAREMGPHVVHPAPAEAGYLGVAIENVDAESAEEAGLSEVRGVRVTDVSDGSPAAEAGVREGDVIVAFDGEEVRSARQLVRLVRETPPGREVEVRIVREGDERTLSVTVGERSGAWPGLDEERMEHVRRQLERARERYGDAMERFGHRFDGDGFELEIDGDRLGIFGGRARLGVRLEGLTDQLAEYFGVEDGALVASVREGSPAAKSGLRAGDVIVRVGDQDVDDPGDVVRAVAGSEAGPLSVTVVRDGEERSVTVELPARGGDEEGSTADQQDGSRGREGAGAGVSGLGGPPPAPVPAPGRARAPEPAAAGGPPALTPPRAPAPAVTLSPVPPAPPVGSLPGLLPPVPVAPGI